MRVIGPRGDRTLSRRLRTGGSTLELRTPVWASPQDARVAQVSLLFRDFKERKAFPRRLQRSRNQMKPTLHSSRVGGFAGREGIEPSTVGFGDPPAPSARPKSFGVPESERPGTRAGHPAS
jgi:hypothetical protein